MACWLVKRTLPFCLFCQPFLVIFYIDSLMLSSFYLKSLWFVAVILAFFMSFHILSHLNTLSFVHICNLEMHITVNYIVFPKKSKSNNELVYNIFQRNVFIKWIKCYCIHNIRWKTYCKPNYQAVKHMLMDATKPLH